MNTPTRNGIFWIILGLALIFASLFFEVQSSTNTLVSHSFSETILKTLDVVGIALFAIGLLNILIETRDWREYFAKALREIVVEQSYLDSLDKEKLTLLQTNILKALFRDQLIDREGSFLNYFHLNLHKYIAEPYREDVVAEIIMVDAGDYWNVVDKVTYVCRKSGGSIQPYILWHVDKNEYSKVEGLKIFFKYPYTHPKKGIDEPLYDGVPTLGDNIQLSLDKFSDVDGLIVVADEQYQVRKADFRYWVMAHPTKNFNVTIIYPPEHTLQVLPMVLSPELLLVTERPGYYSAKYDSWMLPESGVAYRIRPQ
jgi:hypothetical protein